MDSNKRNDEIIEIDLLDLFYVLLGHWMVIVMVAFTAAVVGFVISFFVIAPKYESTTKIYILNKSDNQTVTYSDVQLGTQLTKDYSELINSRYVLEEVIQKLSIEMDYDELKSKVAVSSPNDTRIVAITVTDTDPVLAMTIANAIRESASTHISNVMDIDAVNVVESANMPTEKSSPSYSKFTLLGGLIGGLVICAFFIIQHLLDDRIKTSEDIERYLGISTLGTIPLIEDIVEHNDKNKKKKKKKGKR